MTLLAHFTDILRAAGLAKNRNAWLGFSWLARLVALGSTEHSK